MRQLFHLVLASGALLTAKSALLGVRVLVLLLIAAYGRDTDLASASLAVSLAEIGRWVADFGTDTWTVRAIAIAHDKNEESRLLAAALLIKSVGSMVVGSLILVACKLKFPSLGIEFGWIATVLIPTSQVAGLTIAYFQGKNDLRPLFRLLTPCAVTVLAALLTLLLTGHGLISLTVMALGEVYVSATLLRMLHRRLPLRWRSVRMDALHMARACIPSAAFGIAVGVYSRVDTLVLAGFSLSALAAYTVAQRLFQPFQMAATSFGSVVYARAALVMRDGGSFTRQLMYREMPVIIVCSLACSVLLFVAGNILIGSVFPQSTALGPLTLLCELLPLLAFNSAMTGLLLGYGKFWIVLSIAVVDLAVTVLSMMALVPSRAALGTAESLLLGAFVNGAALSIAAVAATREQRAALRPSTH